MITSKDIFEEMQRTYQEVATGEMSALDGLLYMRGFKEEAEKVLTKVKEFESDFIDDISTEATSNNNSYLGYDITEVKGRELFNFKNIPDYTGANKQLKDIEDTYKQAWKLSQKGQLIVVDGQWVTADGEMKPLPEYSRGKGYIKVTKQK